MDADLDTLLIALYVELLDHAIPGRDLRTGRGPGRPPLVTDAEIVCQNPDDSRARTRPAWGANAAGRASIHPADACRRRPPTASEP